jgi:hypothetical protein
MNRLSLLTCALGVMGAAGVLLACVGDDDGQPPPAGDSGIPVGDSGRPPINPNDATMPESDGGTDAAVDAPPVDAGPQPLVVRVTLNGAPEANVPIVFNDVSGAYLSTAMTDASGSVSQIVTAGTQVTAVFGGASTTQPSLFTVQGVAPGDVITLVDSSSGTSNGIYDQVQLALPSTPWDASAASTGIRAGSCTQEGTEFPISVFPACTSQGEYPLLVINTDENGQELGYTFQKDNPFAPDGGADDAGIINVDIARAWSTSGSLQTIAITNVPSPTLPDAGQDSNNIVQTAVSYGEIAEGLVARFDAFESGQDDAGFPTGAFVMHNGYAEAAQVEATYTLGQSDFDLISSVGIATRSSDAGASSQGATVDLSQVPIIIGSSLDSTDAGTPAQPVVTWTAQGAGAPSGIIANLQFGEQRTDDAGDTQSVDGNWTILAPPSATHIQPPAIPSTYAPATNAIYTQTPRVGLVEGTILPSYGAVRAQLGALPSLFSISGGLQFPPLPVDGTLIVSVFYPDEG